MPTINDTNITKSEKKHKNKDHKRKHQDPQPEPEEETTQQPKKEKKKNKKQKEGIIENTESLNGSVELSEKKKKKKEKDNLDVVEEQVRESEDNVVVSGKDINDIKYKALKSFQESNLSDELLDCCKNFSKPSPIQSNSWPFLLHGRDFIGIAKTGSGKKKCVFFFGNLV